MSKPRASDTVLMVLWPMLLLNVREVRGFSLYVD